MAAICLLAIINSEETMARLRHSSPQRLKPGSSFLYGADSHETSQAALYDTANDSGFVSHDHADPFLDEGNPQSATAESSPTPSACIDGCSHPEAKGLHGSHISAREHLPKPVHDRSSGSTNSVGTSGVTPSSDIQITAHKEPSNTTKSRIRTSKTTNTDEYFGYDNQTNDRLAIGMAFTGTGGSRARKVKVALRVLRVLTAFGQPLIWGSCIITAIVLVLLVVIGLGSSSKQTTSPAGPVDPG